MQELPLHPALVHVPLGISVLMPMLSAAVSYALWREALPKRAWLLVLLVSVVGLGSAVMARNTGELEEQRVEEWVSRRYIHQHEEAADAFLISLGAVTFVCAGLFLVKRPKLFKVGTSLVTLAYVGVLALGWNVGRLGGELVFRHNAGSSRAAE